MSWQVAFQTFTAGLASIAAFFIWELVREYKAFKKDASLDLSNLRYERKGFDLAIQQALLKLDQYRLVTDESIKKINEEMKKFEIVLATIHNQAARSEAFIKKTMELMTILNKRSELFDKELKQVKVKLGEVTIFKSGK